MQQYLDLVELILKEGIHKPNRTGVDTIAYFDGHHRINLLFGFPLLTTKRVPWRLVVEELLWFLRGEKNIASLVNKNVTIWNEWAYERYKDSGGDLGLDAFNNRLKEDQKFAKEHGDLGPIYGYQWRSFEGVVSGVEHGTREIIVVDQIKEVIDNLRNNPESRRIILNAWNPAQIKDMALAPCHVLYVFNVMGGRLNLHMTQRSADIALGVPFNIASCAALTHIIGQEVGIKPGIFGHTLVDMHVYCGDGENFGLRRRGVWYKENLGELRNRMKEVRTAEDYLAIKRWIEDNAPEESRPGLDHIPGLLLQLTRRPKTLPLLEIAKKPLDQLVGEDFKVNGYTPDRHIRFEIAV